MVSRVLLGVAAVGIVVACGDGDAIGDTPSEGTSSSSGGASSTSTPSSSSSSGSSATQDSGALAPTAKTAFENGALVLHTNLPASTAGCTSAGGSAATCADADGDGLTDAWEAMVLDRMRPQIEFDEQEQILSDAKGKTAIVARVTPRAAGAVSPKDPFVVLVYMILAYSRDYGSCGLSGHNVDNERVVLELTVAVGDATITRAYTAAHEGSPADDGHVYAGATLNELRYTEDAEPRWRVLSSRDKHATYANDATCAAHSSVPCLLENCSADGVANIAAFRLVAPYVNAGEPQQHRADDLGPLGFPGETAWGTTTFCGGLGGDGCAGGNADKLTNDPFP